MRYDRSGNEIFRTTVRSGLSEARLQDRASYYSADGMLVAQNFRVLGSPTQVLDNPYTRAFEEYRYDPLGESG